MNIMDDKDMLTLELPDTDGLANADDLSAASKAAENAHEVSYEYSPAENEEDIPMPVLSEMDGSEFSSGAVSAPQPGANSSRRNVSGENSGQGLPQLSEMSDMPYSNNARASGVSGASGQTFSGSQSTYSPVNGNGGTNAGQGTYSSSGSYGGYGSSPAPNRTSYLDMMDEETALAAKGEKIARVIGNITLVISVLDGLVGLLGFNIRIIMGAIYHIYFCVQFKKGSHNSRYWLGAGCVFTVISSIISVIQVDSMTEYAVELTGSSAIITVAQIIALIPVFLFAVLAYFYLLDKRVAAYCERNVGRID